MTNRAAKLVSPIGAVLLASAALVTIELNVAVAADDCLAKPTGGGAGQHWYYHLDRATKRQCWYLRDGATASHATSQTASTGRNAPLSASTANAHAELPASNSVPDDDAKPASAPPATDAGATMQNVQSAVNAGTPSAPPSAINSRWPGGSDAMATVNPSPQQQSFGATPTTPKADTMVTADATVAQTAASNADSVTEDAAAPVATETQGGSSRTLLLAGLAALALAGSLISVIWARMRTRRQIQLEAGAQRGPRWPDELPDETMSPPWRQPAARDLDRHLDKDLDQDLDQNLDQVWHQDLDQGFDDGQDRVPDPVPVQDDRRSRSRPTPVRAEGVVAAARAPRNDLSEIEELLSHYAGQTSHG